MDDLDVPLTSLVSTSLSQPERMYLLCYDLARGRLGDDTALIRGHLLRAAAIAELRLTGWLNDRDGGAVRDSGTPQDAFLTEVLDAVPTDSTRRWSSVLDAHWWSAEESVRDGLAAQGLLTVTRRRWLGVIPYRRITPTDPAGVRDLRERIRRVVLDGDPAGATPADAVLAVIALDAHACNILTARERREHRDSVRALGRRVDAVLPGLREALVWSVAARRSAASA